MELTERWELAPTPAGQITDSRGLADLPWRAARVPGTAAGTVGADGRDFDAEDWWFRCQFAAGPEWVDAEVTLELDGIATVGEVLLNGKHLLEFASMWERHEVDVSGLLADRNELVIGCRALVPLLAQRRRPGARWRTRVVNNGNLRWYRTMAFGRSPGFAPGPAAVGPWRPVRLVRRDIPGVSSLDVRTRLEDTDGVIAVAAKLTGAWSRASVRVGDHRTDLLESADGSFAAELRIPLAERWWPHTHGVPEPP